MSTLYESEPQEDAYQAQAAGGAERLYADLEHLHLAPLWRINKMIMPFEPKSPVKAWLWSYDVLMTLAARAGELIPIDRGGDRRVLAVINPGLPSVYGATRTLWGALQYLGPGESAPAHRHSPSALRFVVEGTGAWTTVDGDRCRMEAGDLVLTPAWTWHDHVNEGSEPMTWFDGLDLPLVSHLDATFFELHPDGVQRPTSSMDSARTHGRAGLAAASLTPAHELSPTTGLVGEGLPASPLLHYPWAEVEQTLQDLRGSPTDPFDDVLIRYVNPRTGGPVLPTIDATIQLLRAGISTRPHQHTHSVVHQVFRGTGVTIVDGEAFHWARGDIFVIPPWAVHEHQAPDVDAVLFAITDAPVLRALGLERTRHLEHPQRVAGVFTPQEL